MANEAPTPNIPTVNSSEPTSSYQPSANCPETWPNETLGFNLDGRKYFGPKYEPSEKS